MFSRKSYLNKKTGGTVYEWKLAFLSGRIRFLARFESKPQ